MTVSDALIRDLAALSAADQASVAEYVAFLHWRARRGTSISREPEGSGPTWCFNFLEHLAEADMRAAKERAGMEVKIAEATVGSERRAALWQHPPLSGEGLVEFHVPVPAGLRDLRLRFSIGIRDGAQADEQLVAFRVRVDGWQIWSRAAFPRAWSPFEISLPFQGGNMLRLAFATDGLGEHQWAWAVWGEPELVGVKA